MTVTVPDYVTAEGNVKVVWVPAIASQTAPKAATELGAATAVDITCYLPENWEGFTADQAKGEITRMCMKVSLEALGKIKRGVSDFTYTYLPQGTDTDPGNKVKAAFVAGAKGFLVVRYGLPATDAFAAGQKVDSMAVQVGAPNKNTTGGDEFAALTMTTSLIARGDIIEGTLVA